MDADRDEKVIADLLRLQDGVISRRQVLAAGGSDNDIERLIRRRIWVRLLKGVYVDHTGTASRHQRAWAATLYYAPAALAGRSALRVEGLSLQPDRSDAAIHVAVHQNRRVATLPGIRVERLVDFDAQAMLHRSPPRVRLEHAVLRVAADAHDESAAVAVIADACQSRRTTAGILLAALRARPRQRHRRLLMTILEDVACGAYSVLERRYLREVERPHGLPTGKRQRRVAVGKAAAYRDVEYLGLRTIVELDGRLGHERATDRWADLDRDMASALHGDLTVRVAWKQVLDPCRLAAGVARILIARGWTGRPRACGPDCLLPRFVGVLPASGAGTTPSNLRPR